VLVGPRAIPLLIAMAQSGYGILRWNDCTDDGRRTASRYRRVGEATLDSSLEQIPGLGTERAHLFKLPRMA
jgi:hypothetical protein